MFAEQSANWLVDRIFLWQQSIGQPLPDVFYGLYRTNVFDLRDEDRLAAVDALNVGVYAIRSAVTYEKQHGVATVKVRRGLRLPHEWQHHYQTVYTTEFPWFISLVAQNAFLGNPAAGETGKWESR